MDTVRITKNIKDKEFFFCDGVFILITSEGKQNLVCVFDDDITDMAREYADKHTPETGYKYNDQTEKGKFIKNDIKQQRTRYWQSLFNLAIWDFLENKNLNNKNKITYMKKP